MTTGSFGKVTGEVLTLLAGIVGDRNVLSGDERQNYSRDETLRVDPVLPEVVVIPEDTGAVAGVLKLANDRRIPVTPRGGGTGLSGGAVPIYGGIVLSLERMNRILEIDKENFVAVVEPGVTLAEVYKAVEEVGLYYPPYPGEPNATIGGNAATNAGGMRAVKYGVTRHSVLGLEAVLPDGEVLSTGGKFVKCATGYDLTQLIIGSEGTLGVITKITLRLIPPAGRREILFVPFHSLHDAIDSVPDILKERILPVGIEFMEKDIIDMVEQHTGKEIPLHQYQAFLLIMVEADSEDDFHVIAERIGKICLGHGAVDIFVPGSERAKRNLLEAREKFYTVIGHYGVLNVSDVVVPRSHIAEFVKKTKEIAAEYGIPLVTYGHAGDGNVHLHPMGQGSKELEEKGKELLKRIYEVGVSFGGTISGEHGLGFVKKGYLPIASDRAKIDLMKRIKLAFDPNNILNPGKVFDLD
ncbi:MAG: FAD-linked oxidase C-terminal domain-containing protein [Dehalococcoidales bacterium]|nr:FAD-linked oxidase C-terminal domain-containing protein [Dehalococcoidales bacterium]